MKTKKSISDDVRRAIALRAYHIWEGEGRPQDRQQAHWQMAEAEVLGEHPAEQVAAAPSPHSETPVTAAKPVKKKAAEPPTSAKPAKVAEVIPPAAKAPKLKAAAAKAAEGAKKTAKVSPAKKAVKAKGATRQS